MLKHDFFGPIDFGVLEKRKIATMPYVPKLRNALDTSNFDEYAALSAFTRAHTSLSLSLSLPHSAGSLRLGGAFVINAGNMAGNAGVTRLFCCCCCHVLPFPGRSWKRPVHRAAR